MSHSSSNGATLACGICTAGKYSQIGATQCSDCENGKHQASEGKDSCDACSAGKAAGSTGATLCDGCPAGKAQGATGQFECVPCTAGTYAKNSSSAICEDCPGDGYSDPGATTCTLCNKLFYYSLDGQCVRCPEGTDCPTDGGSTIEMLTLKEGFWRISSSSSDFLQCPMPGACIGGTAFTNKGNGYCNEGHGGPLCAVVSE